MKTRAVVLVGHKDRKNVLKSQNRRERERVKWPCTHRGTELDVQSQAMGATWAGSEPASWVPRSQDLSTRARQSARMGEPCSRPLIDTTSFTKHVKDQH